MVTRQEALGTLEEGHRAITELVERLSDVDFERGATIGGGEWSARDLVGHLTTWEEVALEALEQWRLGERPTVETEIFGSAEGIDAFNARTVEAKRARTGQEIREAAGRIHDAVAGEIGDMEDDEWNARAPYETERRRHLSELLGSILGAPKRPFGHVFAHLGDLRAYVESLEP
jgi:hypothetical protein